jgi:hypothetical protein
VPQAVARTSLVLVPRREVFFGCLRDLILPKLAVKVTAMMKEDWMDVWENQGILKILPEKFVGMITRSNMNLVTQANCPQRNSSTPSTRLSIRWTMSSNFLARTPKEPCISICCYHPSESGLGNLLFNKDRPRAPDAGASASRAQEADHLFELHDDDRTGKGGATNLPEDGERPGLASLPCLTTSRQSSASS